MNVNETYFVVRLNKPPRLRIHRSSRFRSRLSSSSDKSSGIDDRASRAIRRSTGIPEILVLMTGTYASGTPYYHKNRSIFKVKSYIPKLPSLLPSLEAWAQKYQRNPLEKRVWAQHITYRYLFQVHVHQGDTIQT